MTEREGSRSRRRETKGVERRRSESNKGMDQG